MTRATVTFGNQNYTTDLAAGIDISIPVSRNNGPNAFHLNNAEFKTVEAGSFIGNVRRGGSCNVEDVYFSPHGNATHTECAGHISGEPIYIKDIKIAALMAALVVSVAPENGVITATSLKEAGLGINSKGSTAIVVRTLPNEEAKRERNYSGQNPPYFDAEAIELLNDLGILHILTDLPSLDKEDDGQLKAHHLFFRKDKDWNREKTVTEMIYVPDSVPDGLYALNLQVAAFESDAAPSKPMLYFLHPV
jgi:arylformamidase